MAAFLRVVWGDSDHSLFSVKVIRYASKAYEHGESFRGIPGWPSSSIYYTMACHCDDCDLSREHRAIPQMAGLYIAISERGTSGMGS